MLPTERLKGNPSQKGTADSTEYGLRMSLDRLPPGCRHLQMYRNRFRRALEAAWSRVNADQGG